MESTLAACSARAVYAGAFRARSAVVDVDEYYSCVRKWIQPMMNVVGWLVSRLLALTDSVLAILAMAFADAITFYQRLTNQDEVNYFWVPLLVCIVYIFTWRRVRHRLPILPS